MIIIHLQYRYVPIVSLIVEVQEILEIPLVNAFTLKTESWKIFRNSIHVGVCMISDKTVVL